MTETTFRPFETGLDRFVRMKKPGFIGKPALQRRLAEGPRKRLVTLSLDTRQAPAHAGASLMQDDRVVGSITSGAWGHRTRLNLAYAFVEPDLAKAGRALQLDLCGRMVAAEVIAPSPYDPDFALLRG